jgi:mono/diheme cytochrome c family protein
MRVSGIVGWTAGLAGLACVVMPGHDLAGAPTPPSAVIVPARHAGQQSPKQIFQSVCSTCHGTKGKGDGPAGMAFNPRPANFTDANFWKTHTDAQLVDSITSGIGNMPAFGPTYDKATIQGLVKYLHVLSGLKQGSGKAGAP